MRLIHLYTFPVDVRLLRYRVSRRLYLLLLSCVQGNRERPYILPDALKISGLVPLGIRTPFVGWAHPSHRRCIRHERYQLPCSRWCPRSQSGDAQSYWGTFRDPPRRSERSFVRLAGFNPRRLPPQAKIPHSWTHHDLEFEDCDCWCSCWSVPVQHERYW